MIKNLCAFMYTYNNESTIEKCLDSLKGIATCICVTDMNSKDKTVEIINKWKESNDIYFTLKSAEFIDESTSNNKAFENANMTYPNVEYYLYFKPTRILINKGFDIDKLDKETHILKIINGKYRSIEACMFKMGKKWVSKGVVNAFWVCMDKTNESIVSELEVIETHNDTQEQLLEKIKLLEEGMKNAESDIVLSRYRYYMGLLCYNAKLYNKAVDVLKERIKSPGLIQDLYHSYFLLGMSLYRIAKDNAETVSFLFSAYNNSPYKVESIYKIAKILRKRGQLNAAQLLLDSIRNIRFFYDTIPSNYYVNEFLIDLEYCLCCSQDIFKKKEGYHIFVNLLDKKDMMNKKQLELLESLKSVYFSL